jgi:hypothetical protein
MKTLFTRLFTDNHDLGIWVVATGIAEVEASIFPGGERAAGLAWIAGRTLARSVTGAVPFSRGRIQQSTGIGVLNGECRGGETADAVDSKSTVRKHMGVQVPPSAPMKSSVF